jgi:hypothetical protein
MKTTKDNMLKPPLNQLNTVIRINGKGGLSYVHKILQQALKPEGHITHAERGRRLDEATRLVDGWYKRAMKKKA